MIVEGQAAVSSAKAPFWDLVEFVQNLTDLPEPQKSEVISALTLAGTMLSLGFALDLIPTRSGPIDFALGEAIHDAIGPVVNHLIRGPIENAMRFAHRDQIPNLRQLLRALENGGLDETTARLAMKLSGLQDGYIEPLIAASLKTRRAAQIKDRYDLQIKTLDSEMAIWEADIKPIEDDLNAVISELRSIDRGELDDSLVDRLAPVKDELTVVESVYRSNRRKALAAASKAVST